MKKLLLQISLVLSSAVFITAYSSCNNATDDTTGSSDTSTTTTGDTSTTSNQAAEVTLNSMYPDTTVTGMATFQQNGDKVKLTLNVTIPSKANQSVAVHIHENGDCGDVGKNAGPHWNPGSKDHGKWGENGFHSGDIGNIELDGEGKGNIELETDMWSIGGDSTKNILNRALVVHGGKDDFKSQPSGNAGSRIGCGVITQK